jgi:hypothetical protein
LTGNKKKEVGGKPCIGEGIARLRSEKKAGRKFAISAKKRHPDGAPAVPSAVGLCHKVLIYLCCHQGGADD